jgi:hypothetical protein
MEGMNMDDLKQMCHGCGEMIDLRNACEGRIESGDVEVGIYSYYHFGHSVKEKCSDCGLHRKVCEDCCETML